jgi:uncharacterized protein
MKILFSKLRLFFDRCFSRFLLNQKESLVKVRIPKRVDTLAALEIKDLKLLEVRGIILDLDNTIISEDDRYLSPYAEEWIFNVKDLGIKLFFLSNGKRRYRVEYWSERLNIPAIHPAKKPFPSAFCKAIKLMQLSPNQVVVIGDSRHTDILGAWFVGCRSIQVASLPHPPHWWETLFGKLVQVSYPKDQVLWEFQALAHYKKN